VRRRLCCPPQFIPRGEGRTSGGNADTSERPPDKLVFGNPFEGQGSGVNVADIIACPGPRRNASFGDDLSSEATTVSKEQPGFLPGLIRDGDENNHPGTGILPYQMIEELARHPRAIMAVPDIAAEQIQPASIDLRLGHQAFRVRASFLPGRTARMAEKLEQMDGLPPLDLTGGAVLEKGCVYVIPLLEHVKLPHDIMGTANPKSSTGRLDILTRLITDHGTAFDNIPSGYEGKLYVEVAPKTFSIVVSVGSRLNQLRFRRGNPRLSKETLNDLYGSGQILRTEDGQKLSIQNDYLVPVSIDLRGSGRPGRTIGFRAKKHTEKIDIDKTGKYDPDKFWDRLEYQSDETLILDPDEFYILATREEVGVPPHLAAEMVPYYPSSGEYRVHYAGFFDPGFGWKERAGGSRAVLEVRSYVPFMLEHGQIVGWLHFMPMAAAPDRVYGSTIQSNYQNQGLALSKHFRPDPRSS
jgi:dCTP deaminase